MKKIVTKMLKRGNYCPLIKTKCIEDNCVFYVFKSQNVIHGSKDGHAYEFDCGIVIMAEKINEQNY